MKYSVGIEFVLFIVFWKEIWIKFICFILGRLLLFSVLAHFAWSSPWQDECKTHTVPPTSNFHESRPLHLLFCHLYNIYNPLTTNYYKFQRIQAWWAQWPLPSPWHQIPTRFNHREDPKNHPGLSHTSPRPLLLHHLRYFFFIELALPTRSSFLIIWLDIFINTLIKTKHMSVLSQIKPRTFKKRLVKDKCRDSRSSLSPREFF